MGRKDKKHNVLGILQSTRDERGMEGIKGKRETSKIKKICLISLKHLHITTH